jgi:hypothetical protein
MRAALAQAILPGCAITTASIRTSAIVRSAFESIR